MHHWCGCLPSKLPSPKSLAMAKRPALPKSLEHLLENRDSVRRTSERRQASGPTAPATGERRQASRRKAAGRRKAD